MTIHRAMNLLGLAFLVTSLLCFAVFHFLPGEAFDEGRGWRIWPEIWEGVRDPGFLQDVDGLIGVGCFLCFIALVVASPFLFGVFRRSRLAWWLATLFSGLATMGFWVAVLRLNSWDQLGVAGSVLLASPLCNLIGLMLLRGERRVAEPLAGPSIEQGNP
jgi:hypothetical protein